MRLSEPRGSTGWSRRPALLAGLERLLAIDDLMRVEDLGVILALARRQLPRLFPTGPDSPIRKRMAIPMPDVEKVEAAGHFRAARIDAAPVA